MVSPPPKPSSVPNSKAPSREVTPPIQLHADGSTTYSSKEQLTIARLSIHAASQYLKNIDAAAARRKAKQAAPYPAESSQINEQPRHGVKNKQRRASSSKRAPIAKGQSDSKHPDNAMDLDNQDQLISEPESPIDQVTGEFKTSAFSAKGKTARIKTSSSTAVVPVDNAGGN